MTKPALDQMQKLVDDLAVAIRELDSLLFDEEYPHKPGKPCTPEQITGLERLLGKSLPPSYLAFLKIHNGWRNFSGGTNLLAVEDQGSSWVEKRKDELDELFYEDDDNENPFNSGAIPILLGEDVSNYLVLDPDSVGQDGEMDFVAYDFTEKEERFTDFTSFLRYQLDLYLEMIEDERSGVDYEENTED